jgi:single-strand DNA-binding protein
VNDLNSVLIEGELLEDVRIDDTRQGTPVCVFTISSGRFVRRAGGETGRAVSYFDVEARAGLVEKVRFAGSEGRKVRIVGRLRGVDDIPHAHAIIIAEAVEFRPLERGGTA